jgi:hypothetical protein
MSPASSPEPGSPEQSQGFSRLLSVAGGTLLGMSLTLADIERIVRSSWGPDTYPPDASRPWDPDNPARGQCGVVALVVNDLLGGELMRAEVHVNGERADFHWWNRMPSGLEIDLTREQFRSGEVLTSAVAITRPPTSAMKRMRTEYELLRQRVFDAVARHETHRPEAGVIAEP